MKKILSALFLVAILLIPNIFAIGGTVYNRTELVNELRRGIASGSSEISINYNSNTGINDTDFLNSVFKEAIKDFDYERNNYDKISIKRTPTQNGYTLTWLIAYRTNSYEESIISSYAKSEALRIKNMTSNSHEQVKILNKNIMDKLTYSYHGISTGTAYGAITDGKVICHGYTMITNRILTELGIENKIIIGITNQGEKHSWNLVNLNGSWYHLDVTHNDASNNSVEYFLKSDNHMRSTRTWNGYEYPRAVANYTPSVNTPSVIYETAKVEPKEVYIETAKVEPEVEYTETAKETTYIEAPKTKVSSFYADTYDVSRELFINKLMELYTKRLGTIHSSKVFYDTTNENISMAYELGITYGVGNNYFAPNRLITREEAAVMLYRLITIFESDNYNTNVYIADRNDISEWALEAINYLKYNNIMVGDPAGNFMPKSNLNNEELSILISRVDNYIK